MSALRLGLLTTAITMIAMASGYAQVPGMFPWWDNPIAQDLGLSDAQTKQIKATVREWRDRIWKLADAVEDAEAEFKTQMNADPVDNRKTEEAIEKLVSARGELTRAVSQMSLKLRTVLTTSQWQELQRRQPRPGGDRPPYGRERGPGRPPDFNNPRPPERRHEPFPGGPPGPPNGPGERGDWEN